MLARTPSALLATARDTLRAYPKTVIGTLAALLLGTSVTAFGLSPLAPDAAQLPVTERVEPVAFSPLGDHLLASAPSDWVLYRTDVTRADDSAASLLRRLGVRDPAAVKLLSSDPRARALFSGRTGKVISAEVNPQQKLLRLVARWLPNDERVFQRLDIRSSGANWHIESSTAPLTSEVRLGSGVIRHSLFAAIDAANLPDSIGVQLAEMFSSEIDFRRDLRTGDRFSVVYEVLAGDGEVLRAGRILSAEFASGAQVHQAVWFQASPQDKGGYYTFDGKSTRKSVLVSPLEFSRVSSGYGMRFHPISGTRKEHLGVDYAAPTGTPVRSVADGVVTFAGVQRGYGQVIEVEHRGQQSTLYAHLSRIGVRKGQKVSQGDNIGAVGSTGASTGPHLHFEFRDKGVHQDPLEVARRSEVVELDAKIRARFRAETGPYQQQLAAARQLNQANME